MAIKFLYYIWFWFWIGDGHGNVDQLVFRCHKKGSLNFRNKFLMEQGKERRESGINISDDFVILASGGDTSSLGSKGKEIRRSRNIEIFKGDMRKCEGSIFYEVYYRVRYG